MKDKFEIFSALIAREAQCNHFGTYISIGQLADLIRQTNWIEKEWDDNVSFKENMGRINNRVITPLGDAGKNRM